MKTAQTAALHLILVPFTLATDGTAAAAVVLNRRAAIRKPTEALALTGFRVLVAL